MNNQILPQQHWWKFLQSACQLHAPSKQICEKNLREISFLCFWNISGIFYFSSWNMVPTLHMLRLYFCSVYLSHLEASFTFIVLQIKCHANLAKHRLYVQRNMPAIQSELKHNWLQYDSFHFIDQCKNITCSYIFYGIWSGNTQDSAVCESVMMVLGKAAFKVWQGVKLHM